jgi:hypothetical protein
MDESLAKSRRKGEFHRQASKTAKPATKKAWSIQGIIKFWQPVVSCTKEAGLYPRQSGAIKGF